jgi:hypothetical protein
MKLKKLDITTDDFYYDLFEGGGIDPDEILDSSLDSGIVKEAVKVIQEFKRSCEEQIEDFYF